MSDFCASCLSPGHCCRAIPIGLFVPLSATAEQAKAMLTTRGGHEYRMFQPLRRDAHSAETKIVDGAKVARWLWSCDWLLADGRCGNYENRPLMCRSYVPGSDPLCFHHDDDAPVSAMSVIPEENHGQPT